jgi:hypothetical protein
MNDRSSVSEFVSELVLILNEREYAQATSVTENLKEDVAF